MDAGRRVAVHRAGVEFGSVKMRGPCVVLRGEVVHRGEIVEFVAHFMGRYCVRDLRRRVVIQRRIARHHAAEKGDVDRRVVLQRLLVGVFIIFACDGELG